MTPERWHRIQDLFGTVADLPTALRAQYLTSACRDAPALRQDVEALLRADHADGDGAFIRRTVAAEMAGLRPVRHARHQ